MRITVLEPKPSNSLCSLDFPGLGQFLQASPELPHHPAVVLALVEVLEPGHACLLPFREKLTEVGEAPAQRAPAQRRKLCQPLRDRIVDLGRLGPRSLLA
jgi:hypothetical protein